MPPRNRHKPPPETIRMILRMKFPRIYSNEEELAATGVTRTLGPTLSPSLQTSTSKRSMDMMLSLSSDAESDQQHLPLYRALIAWQSPIPGHYVLHLADNLDLKCVKSIGNLDALLAAHILTYAGLDFQIPSSHQFSVQKRWKALKVWDTVGERRAETIEDLVEAHDYRETLAAACASVLIGNAAVKPKHVAMSGRIADFKNAHAIAWTDAPRTLLPGCDEVRAAGYHAIDPALPGLAESIRAQRRDDLEAIDRFRLADAAVTDIQPICAPLNPNFPLYSMIQIAKEQIPLESFKCHGSSNPEHYCRSPRCECGPESSKRLMVSGRPTGVDGEPALKLISQAETTSVPTGQFSAPALRTGSLLAKMAWSKAVATDSTFITISGNNQYVLGIRDRANQTLLLSDPQEIDRDPMIRYPAYLPAQIGYAILAYDDACSRGRHMEDRRRKGTLPHRFRQRLDSEVDPLNSDLPFTQLASFYERDVGLFLPPALSNPEYTFQFNLELFQQAAQVSLYWDADDAHALQDLVGDSSSPLLLNIVEDPSDASQILDVKIHSWMQHGHSVVLGHFIDDKKAPYGRPVVIKARRSRRTSEIVGLSAISQEVEAGRDTQDLEHEVDVLKTLGRTKSLASRVPRLYGLYSSPIKKDGPDFKISAYFMEHCEGYYPLGIADEISSTLRDNLTLWRDTLHCNDIVHRNLSGENILFNPSEPDSFYVTGWGRSSTGIELPGWENGVIDDIESLLTLFTRKEPDHVPMEKRMRYTGADYDPDSMQEDDGDILSV